MNQTARIAQASQTVIRTQGPAAHWPSGPLSGGRTPLAGQPGPPQVAPCQCTHSCPSVLNSLPSQRLSWSSLDPFTFPTGVTLTPPHVTDKQTEAQQRQETCPRTLSQEARSRSSHSNQATAPEPPLRPLCPTPPQGPASTWATTVPPSHRRPLVMAFPPTRLHGSGSDLLHKMAMSVLCTCLVHSVKACRMIS